MAGGKPIVNYNNNTIIIATVCSHGQCSRVMDEEQQLKYVVHTPELSRQVWLLLPELCRGGPARPSPPT